MKYTLLKKFHPNQVEEIGHVFEEEATRIYYSTTFDTSRTLHTLCEPHEIALLIHAGFLEIYDELFFSNEPTPFGSKESPAHKLKITEKIEDKLPNNHIECSVKGCGKCSPIHFTPEQKIDLWADFPPEGTKVWTVSDRGHTEPNIYNGDNVDIFRLKTKNCHRTKESAEEALKLLKSKYEIE